MAENQPQRPLDYQTPKPPHRGDGEESGALTVFVHLIMAVSVALILAGLGIVLARHEEGGAVLMGFGGLFVGGRLSLWLDERRRP